MDTKYELNKIFFSFKRDIIVLHGEVNFRLHKNFTLNLFLIFLKEIKCCIFFSRIIIYFCKIDICYFNCILKSQISVGHGYLAST